MSTRRRNPNYAAEPDSKGSEALVLLLNPEVHGTYESIVQKAADGTILGGLS
jgi:hypothetical protein